MTQHSHQTAPTRFEDAAGVRFAYRRFGKSGGVPLVFNMRSTGTMDHWDPAVTDGFAKDREVILFDNAGISSNSGEVPTSIEEMAADAAALVTALGLTEVNVLGCSLAGLSAQTLAIAEPKLVRRVVLVGTGPRSGEGMATLTPQAQEIFGATYEEPDNLWLRVHFSPRSRARPPAAISSSGSGCGGRSRSGGQREGCPGTARSTREMGGAARESARVSEETYSADPHRERRRRRDHVHDIPNFSSAMSRCS